jgi:hypothetical protein
MIPMYLAQNYPLGDGSIISTATPLYPITKDYLLQSSFPSDEHEELLNRAAQSKNRGETYVDCPRNHKLLSIPSHFLNVPI